MPDATSKIIGIAAMIIPQISAARKERGVGAVAACFDRYQNQIPPKIIIITRNQKDGQNPTKI